jgi:hypothetical protein
MAQRFWEMAQRSIFMDTVKNLATEQSFCFYLIIELREIKFKKNTIVYRTH